MNRNIITKDEWYQYTIIQTLQNTIIPDKLVDRDVALDHMISKKKEKLVRQIYKKTHPRSNRFYQMSDGRWRSRNPDFYARSESGLIEKLYNYYFARDMEAEFDAWILHRASKKLVSEKTIEEDLSYWNRVISKERLAHVPMSEIRAVDLYNMFVEWTGQGKITRKEFNNRKSILNGIYSQAVLDGIVEANPIPSLQFSSLKFKNPSFRNKAYSLEQREKMLAYLKSIEQDAYTLAIQLAFHGTFRIGEIKALKSTNIDGGYIWIENQIVDEHEIIVKNGKVSLGEPVKTLKQPKGNTNYSIRPSIITPETANILRQAKELNPDGEYLFMHHGRALTTDTVNSRLRKYTKAIGIPYLSSHKIRFTSASVLYQDGNMDLKDLSYFMGHSNLQMTQHYAEQRIRPIDGTRFAEVLG